jgi:hypothetical protein
MEMLRRQFGIAEPIRRGMELKIAAAGEWRPAVLGPSGGVHRDILQGRDCEVQWEDVFVGKCYLVLFVRSGSDGWSACGYIWIEANIYNTGNELREVPDFHTEMEARMKMNWWME